MNKIYFYILGVLCWVNSSICYAMDKFEILPDLPEALSYAVQPASASTVSGAAATSVLDSQSIGHEPSIISVVFSLLIVVLLIYLTGIIYSKLNNVGYKTMKRQQNDLSKTHVSVLSTTQLGNNKTLHVVELDGKRMLIGASTGAMQLIKDLGSASTSEFGDDYSHIEIPNIKIPKIEIPKIEIPTINFAKLKTKTHVPIKEVEIEQEASLEIDNESVVQEEVNQEVIIDSLFAAQEEPVEEIIEENTVSEHKVDPDEYALYKKYLS